MHNLSAEMFIDLGECTTPTGRMAFTLKLKNNGFAILQVYHISNAGNKKLLFELDREDVNKIENIMQDTKKMVEQLKNEGKLKELIHEK